MSNEPRKAFGIASLMALASPLGRRTQRKKGRRRKKEI
jgi:hypothetical protein